MGSLTEEYWTREALQLIANEEYAQIVSFYEQGINTTPEIKSSYWYLGLTLFLEGKKSEAETTWLMAMMAGDEERVEIETLELVSILEAEVNKQNSQGNQFLAWQLRQQIFSSLVFTRS